MVLPLTVYCSPFTVKRLIFKKMEEVKRLDEQGQARARRLKARSESGSIRTMGNVSSKISSPKSSGWVFANALKSYL